MRSAVVARKTAAQRDAHAKNMDSLALPFAENVVVLAAQTHSCLIYQMNMTQRGRIKQKTNPELIQGVPEPRAKGLRIQAGLEASLKAALPSPIGSRMIG